MSEQLSHLIPNIRTPHQRLSYKNRVDSRFFEFHYVLVCIDATFADNNFIGWDGVSQVEGGCDVCVEGFQISVIDANDFCAPRQRQFQFCFGMDFDQACEPPSLAPFR